MMKEPVTNATLDSDNTKIDDLNIDMVGKDFVHLKTGGVYVVRDFIWDADTDQWAVLYQRKDNKGAQFKRLLKNFLFKEDMTPRFVKLDYGSWKPSTTRDSSVITGDYR